MNYKNVDFPLHVKYKRNKNRIYFSTNPKDGEELEYYGQPEKPNSSALGYRYYKDSKGNIHLIHYTDIL